MNKKNDLSLVKSMEYKSKIKSSDDLDIGNFVQGV
jgi:hypothetical protein